MSITNDLAELVSAKIISDETAQQISDYYSVKNAVPVNKNRQLLIFGIAGAILVGIGLMFIVANQWEKFPNSVKTFLAFSLLIVPQLMCIYILIKKEEKIIWKESLALTLFFAVGANISLVAQIYQITGETSSFILTWMILTLPLVYILNASSVSLAYFIGIVSYNMAVRFDPTQESAKLIYWVLFALPLPYYFSQFKKSPDYPLFVLHHWVIPFILIQTLVSVGDDRKELLSVAYFALFGVFYLIGNLSYFRNRNLIRNGYRVFGVGGTIVSLLVMSYESNWISITGSKLTWSKLFICHEFYAIFILFTLASVLLYRQNINKALKDWKFPEYIFLIYILIFILGIAGFQAFIIVNLLVLGWGLLLIRQGSKKDLLGLMNLGMMVIALLVFCRSFDSGLTFVVKGILFMLVGIGFFMTNWLMLSKRQKK